MHAFKIRIPPRGLPASSPCRPVRLSLLQRSPPNVACESIRNCARFNHDSQMHRSQNCSATGQTAGRLGCPDTIFRFIKDVRTKCSEKTNHSGLRAFFCGAPGSVRDIRLAGESLSSRVSTSQQGRQHPGSIAWVHTQDLKGHAHNQPST